MLGTDIKDIIFDDVEQNVFELIDRFKSAEGDPDTIKLLKEELITLFNENINHTHLRAAVSEEGDLAPLIDYQRGSFFTFFATHTRNEINKKLREDEPRCGCRAL